MLGCPALGSQGLVRWRLLLHLLLEEVQEARLLKRPQERLSTLSASDLKSRKTRLVTGRILKLLPHVAPADQHHRCSIHRQRLVILPCCDRHSTNTCRLAQGTCPCPDIPKKIWAQKWVGCASFYLPDCGVPTGTLSPPVSSSPMWAARRRKHLLAPTRGCRFPAVQNESPRHRGADFTHLPGMGPRKAPE